MTEPVLLPHLRRFLEANPAGVLATSRPDGVPRQSVVYHLVDGDRLLISTEATRAKARDVERTGRASYCVVGAAKPYPQVSVTGSARILTDDIGGHTARLFEIISGNASAPMSDDVLAAIGRVLLELVVERVVVAQYLPEEG